MTLYNGIWLIILGVMGAASLIVSKRPDAKDALAKLAPYQGWFGAASAIWGVFGVIQAILALGWLSVAPILWITYLADTLLEVALGLLLGVGVLKTFIKNEQANAKMDQTITKLAPYQGTLGLIAIGLGAWMIVAGFLFTIA